MLCIFISRIAFGGTINNHSIHIDKKQQHSFLGDDANDTDDETDAEKKEFKDFLIAANQPPIYAERSILIKIEMNFILPIIHLTVPIQPPC